MFMTSNKRRRRGGMVVVGGIMGGIISPRCTWLHTGSFECMSTIKVSPKLLLLQ